MIDDYLGFTNKWPRDKGIWYQAANNPMRPINWNIYVTETLRRRKVEKLTQKSHAALADVSIPTMRSFERGDLKLSLHTAFRIMKVIGLS